MRLENATIPYQVGVAATVLARKLSIVIAILLRVQSLLMTSDWSSVPSTTVRCVLITSLMAPSGSRNMMEFKRRTGVSCTARRIPTPPTSSCLATRLSMGPSVDLTMMTSASVASVGELVVTISWVQT
ncbi:hypothetical protein DPMN_017476 [Dreissena polymorpha]|uniref:Uncharacterized protein n=1 Tax=Dreissena polymorpha TaxID=45954 RepID=A0A9D4NGR9_DREPO|nr:hypothetical protein DPMN_017476 [Dreissena polymorpha]